MTELSLVNSNQRTPLGIYLDLLFEGGEGYVYSPVKKEDDFEQHFFQWPTQREELEQHVLSTSPVGDVYIAPALFTNSQNASRENVKFARCFWADFDGNLPTALHGVPEPTVRVRTSVEGHEHWYWRTDEWLNADSLETTNRALTYLLGADGSGWDAVQVLRPPATTNHKHGMVTRLVKADDQTLSRMEFAQYEPPPRIGEELLTEEIPDAYDVVMAYAWSKQAMQLYRSIPTGMDRSSALMQLAYFCGEMGMSDAEMYSILRNADDRWGKFKNRTDRDRRLVDLISVARVKYVLKSDGLQAMGLRTLLNTEVNIEWVIEGLLQERGYFLLTGRSGVGKTQFSLRFAINLALGRNYLGYIVGDPMRLLFFSLEMGLADLKYFLQSMIPKITSEELEVLEQNLIFVPLGESLHLNKSPVQKQVEDLINRVDPDGIFFDSLGSMSDEELSNESLVKSIMDWDAAIRNKFNLFTWYIHHQRKAQAQNKKPTDLSDVYGSHYITARATSVYCMWPENELIEVSCLKKRLAKREEPFMLERLNDLEFTRYTDYLNVEVKYEIDKELISGDFGLNL